MKPPLDTRQLDPARILEPEKKTQLWTHVEVVRDIADELFAYPDPDFPHLRTFVNEPEPIQKIFTNYGLELVPDIVVLEWPEKLVRIVGEVPTVEQLTMDNAHDKWWHESRLEGVTFYLYVPSGYLKQAKLLLKDAKIREKDIGLRTWRRIVGLQRIDAPKVR